MPVAPVQLDVNIDLQASAAPTVESVQAAGEGVYIVFDQYMNTDTLTADQFVLLVNGGEAGIRGFLSGRGEKRRQNLCPHCDADRRGLYG